jgi:hypothetical protein
LTTRQSSRGSHKRARQARMDLESTFKPPDVKPERLKDQIITLFDDDFSPTAKAIKDWIIESSEVLDSYFKRKSKLEEVKVKKLTFNDGIKYFRNVLLTELLIDRGASLENAIMDDLSPLVSCEEHEEN